MASKSCLAASVRSDQLHPDFLAGSGSTGKAQKQARERKGGCSSSQKVQIWQQQPCCTKEGAQLHEAHLCLQSYAGSQGDDARIMHLHSSPYMDHGSDA